VIRYHLDEDVDHAVAAGLRNRGIDVTTSTDAALVGASDLEQIAYALREGRVLVTHDADHLQHASSGAEHSGIAFCRQGSRSIGEIISTLKLMHDVLSDDEIRGRVEYI
jgi:predicted nuclease of predicted toxin-antitoxin system